MPKLYTCLLAILVACSGALVGVSAVSASTAPTPPSKQQAPDLFKATIARQGNRQTGPGTHPNASSRNREIPAMRSRNALTQASNDGYVTEIFSNSINYRDNTGSWQPIDDTFVPATGSGYAVKNKANSYTALLPQSLKLPVGFATSSGSLQLQMVGAAGSIATRGASAIYNNAISGVSITYTAQSDGLKEAISLSSVQAPTEFSYVLTLPSGWSAQQNGQGGIDLLDANHASQAALLPPFMYDSSHRQSGHSGSVAMTLGGSSPRWTITVAADKNWIEAPGRKFPVVIDPTIWTNTNYYGGFDCSIQNTFPYPECPSAGQTGSVTAEEVGYSTTLAEVSRILHWFPIQTQYTHIVPNANILDAELDLTVPYSVSTPIPVTVYPIQQSWTNGQVTWSNAANGTPWTTPGGTLGTAISTLNVGPSTGTYAFVGLTQTIQGWVSTAGNGLTSNNGLLLRSANESQESFLSFDNQNFDTANPTDPSNPHLRVQWNAWGGLQPWYTFAGGQVDDRMSIAVNVANGQLVVHNHDLGVQGVGLNLSVDRYYNSFSDIQWHLGNGWNLNAGCDIRIDLDDNDGVAYWSPDGYEVLFRNNGSGGYITPPGMNADLVKNPDGTFTMTFHGSNLKYNFQTGGCLQNEVDRNGNTISMSYNGSLQTITDTENRATTFSYASSFSSDFITQMTDSASRIYQYGYDTNGNLTSFTDPNNKVTHYAYNANNQMSQITDPNGNVINFGYSTTYPQPLTQISRIDPSCPAGACNTTFAYNSGAGSCTVSGVWMNTVVTDANSHSATYCYDNLGRVVEAIDPLGNATAATYDSNNDLTLSTDALGQSTHVSYDGKFNVTKILYPPSATGQTAGSVTFNYQVSGQPYLASSQIDSLGNCGAFFYDPSGNLNTVSSGLANPCDGHTGGVTTCNAYQGNPTGTCGATSSVSCAGAKPGELCWAQDGNGHRTAYAYDPTGNPSSITPPAPLGLTQIMVDSLSRTTSITDGKGQRTSFSYDALDRVVQILYGGATTCSSASTCTTLHWDADGNATSQADATGTTAFTYDHLNRLTVKSLPDSTTNCAGQSGMTTAYDGAGNLTQYCDAGGTTNYSYDASNRLLSMAESGGSCTGTVSLCTTYQYDHDGRLLSVQFPGGATQGITYDNVGNLTAISGIASSNSVLTKFSYSYTQGTQDLNVRVGMTENDPLANLTTTYTYDSLGRLTQASNSQTTLSYAYDAAGNRTSGPSGPSTFNNADEVTSSPGVSSYSFDADGNLTGSSVGGGSFSYDSQNQNTAVTWSGATLSGMSYAGVGQGERTVAGSNTYASGALGLAVSKTSGSSTYFIHDPTGRLIGERTPDGNHWYYLKDGLGSIVAVINGSGSTVGDRYAYDPYGKVIYSSGSVANPWGYAGGYQDTTGLVKFGGRYYDPNLGRFTQLESSALTPAYSYAADNPIVFSDPSGSVVVCDCASGGGSDPLPPPPTSPRPPSPFPSPAPAPSIVIRALAPTAQPQTNWQPNVSTGLVAKKRGPLAGVGGLAFLTLVAYGLGSILSQNGGAPDNPKCRPSPFGGSVSGSRLAPAFTPSPGSGPCPIPDTELNHNPDAP